MPAKCANEYDVGALFDEHASFVWRVLKRHGLPERELADGCQEVFLVVHRRIGEFEGRSSVRTWLYAIAVRVAARMRRKGHLRREQLVDVLPERQPHDSESEEGRELERKELLASLHAALATLSDQHREVFALYELEGLTMAEVAEALSLPESTALYRLYGARERIRAFMERGSRPSWRRAARAGGKP